MNFEELKSILIKDEPSALLKEKEDELFSLIPELSICKGFDQNNPWHIYDVYTHILKVTDATPPILTVRLAALFHDVGKPDTYFTDEKGIGHFYGHWEKSVEIFKSFANKHKLDPEFSSEVAELIHYHDMDLGKVTDKTLDRIIANFTEEGLKLLFAHKRADLLAQNPKYHGGINDIGIQEKRALDRKLGFRLAKKEEADAILALYDSVRGKGFCVWNESYPTMLEIDADLKSNGLYVLTDGVKLAGTLSVITERELDSFDIWERRDNSVCEVGRIAVSEEYRGRGLAYRMITEISEILKKRGHSAIHLSVAKSNTPALKTYAKAGFVTRGEAFIYENDYYLIEKPLSPRIDTYKIREIEKRDDKAVEDVIRTCLIEFGANHEGTAWADPDLCRFSEIYNKEGAKYWVAEDESGKIVGGVGIGPLDAEGVCELQKMYCLAEARGTGVASRLIKIALDYAKDYYAYCYLETLPNMTRAMRFYEKCGFERTDKPPVLTEHYACDVRYIRSLEDLK